jgi:hypothetical protein
MPLLILAALVVIVLMLYIALGGKEGAPTINLNKILDFINPKPPAEDAQDADAAAAGKGEPAAAATPGNAQGEPAVPPAAAETPKDAADAPSATEWQAETNKDGAAEAAAFASMEELTEFYRKEAERLTGIKH